MKNCKNCGVELEENMNFCPLCGEPVAYKTHKNKAYLQFQKTKQEEKILSDFNELTHHQRQKLFWELSGIILISGMIITFIIDLIINQSVTWSKYSMSVCLVLFINVTLIVFLQKKIYVLLSGSFVSVSILLILFDLFSQNTGWGIKIGIPMILCFYFVVFGLIKIVRRSRRVGINLIAYFLVTSAIFCLCIDGVISLQRNNRLNLQWSVIVLASVLPVAAILLYIHYRLKKGTNLKRFFHI
jgi:hypothetical protein